MTSFFPRFLPSVSPNGSRGVLLLSRHKPCMLPILHVRKISSTTVSRKHLVDSGATDEVISLHFVDTTYRDLILHHLSRYDDVLDAEMLRDSLVRLIQRDGWRKLGARLRKNRNGNFEYHIPSEFSSSRPAVSYHHEVHATSINAHPLASRLPRASEKPKIVAVGDNFLPLMRQPGGPEKLIDYLDGDRPILGLNIVSFTDSTLVTLSCSHAVLDGGGRKALLEAWSRVLQGRVSEVPALHGYREDPLAALGSAATAPYHHEKKLMTPWQTTRFVARAIYDRLFRKRSFQSRIVCVPEHFVSQLRARALSDLAPEHGSRTDDALEAPWLSTGDILCAWWARMVVRAGPQDPQREVVVNNVLGLRMLHDLLPQAKAYVSNAMMLMPSFFTARDLVDRPLGQIALVLRQAITRLKPREQLEARFRLDKAVQQKQVLPVLYGSAGMRMIVCTNWCQNKPYEVDFSAAVIQKPGGDHKTRGEVKVGRPSYLQLHGFSHTAANLNTFSINKDAEGHYWICSLLPTTYWNQVERLLEKDFENATSSQATTKTTSPH